MKKLCITLLIIIGAMIVLLVSACSSTKTVTKTQTKLDEKTTSKENIQTVTNTETKAFGDSLNGSNFIPAFALTDTDYTIHVAETGNKVETKNIKKHQPYSVTGESKGIKYRNTFIPQYNNGKYVGVLQNFSIIAKPTSTTDTHEVQHSDVSTTIKKDSAAKADSKIKSKTGFGLPSWVWWTIGLIILAIVAFIFARTFIIQKLKTWIL